MSQELFHDFIEVMLSADVIQREQAEDLHARIERLGPHMPGQLHDLRQKRESAKFIADERRYADPTEPT